MLAEIRRKEELQRVNQKFGPPPKNVMDEAERLIEPDVPGRDSDLLNTGKLLDQVN